MTLACILGCGGHRLTRDEAAFFRDADPWGFILFGRNVDTPEQVRALTAALREAVGRADAPVLVDQEGGRVQRLTRPHWPRYPAARAYGELERHLQDEIAWLGARLIAADLSAVGINVDCAPVLDVPDGLSHDVIGDRAFSRDPETVARLGRAMAEGLLAGGVLPVLKHAPGHGRARADTHHGQAIVDAAPQELTERDFAPFRALGDMPIAMTAHVTYAAVDPERPATHSPTVVSQVIRGAIGFQGLLISDDLTMAALPGGLSSRAQAAVDAGCDIVLHGAGVMAEMNAVAEGSPRLDGVAATRADSALARIAGPVAPFDVAAGRARFEAAFEGRWAA